MVKIFFNNSCNICRAEISHYKKHCGENIEWIDVTNNVEAQKITSETGVPHEVDHIFPLQGKHHKGWHSPENMQIVPKRWNASKKNRVPNF